MALRKATDKFRLGPALEFGKRVSIEQLVCSTNWTSDCSPVAGVVLYGAVPLQHWASCSTASAFHRGERILQSVPARALL